MAKPAGRRDRRQEPSRPGLAWRLLRALPGVLTALLLLWAGAFYVLAPELPDTDELVRMSRQARITLLASDGAVLAERGTEGAPYVTLGEISPWLVKAVLATEDRRFYRHFGLDPWGTLRAAVRNLFAGSYVAGGSTITQQLAKNLYLSPERSIVRKLRELFLALWLEARLSKDQILELYLNRVYFGAGAYGIEAAARTYFGKSARDLDLAESAMLAGLLKAPSRYAPTRDLARARARAATVLSLMVEAGYLDAKAAAAARARPAKPVRGSRRLAARFLDWVLDRLTRQLGKPDRDRVVRTTLDRHIQSAAETAVRRWLKGRPGLEAAVLVLDERGAVRAMVGGRLPTGRLNRAVASRRQPGSAFKPFVYAAALAVGHRPGEMVEDRPFSINGWRPRNHDGRYRGRITLETAFADSVNTVAVRLAHEIGPRRVARLAHELGIGSRLRAVPSLALGTSEVTPFELTSAYLPFMNGGLRRPPFAVARVEDKAGRTIYRHHATEIRVLEPRVVNGMRRLFRAVVERGTGRRARLSDRVVYGKTGTSQRGRDGWFVGFSGRHLIGVWVGRDDSRPVPGLTGGRLPAQIFRTVMKAIPAQREVAQATPAPPRPRRENGLELLLDWLGGVFQR